MVAHEDIIKKVKEAVYKIDPNAEIILFGSRARGDFKPTSDWDFLILTSQVVNEGFKSRIRRELFYAELELDQAISSVIHNKFEWNNKHQITPLFQNIASEGIIL
jgi:uncharacterized protein